MSLKLDAESYLKSGSNELRVLEYRTTNMSFGINILKVSKIVSDLVDFTSLPESHPAIKGVFKEMDRLVPVIDLAEFLGVANEETKREKVIVTEFFGVLTGFWVHKIDWIHHFQWEDVIDAEQVFANIDQRYVLGIVKPTEDRMVLLLDYETMLLDLCPHLRQHEVATEMVAKLDFSDRKILVVEDSPAVRAMLVDQFTSMGAEVAEANDGAQGWETYQQDNYDLVVCDVEMPVMDGLALTLKIRQSERSSTPVVVYSSIGDIGMQARAKFLKADAHITKLNLGRLVETADLLMRGEKVDFDQLSAQDEPIPEAQPQQTETVPLD
jgi:two-component system chemotaxis response regulator CheV